MRINNNIMALNTHRQYAINNENMAKATSRLSSGYRINNAADDAAGLAISEKMRAQIRGLNMAAKNSQDAISLVQTAEGALEETEAILQRMRELAVQAASDTNQEIDRNALDAEFQQLIKEIDDIANKADFNGTKLLDGSLRAGLTAEASGTVDASAATDPSAVENFLNVLSGLTDLEAGTYTVEIQDGADNSDPDPDDPAVITFKVGGTEKYRIQSGASFEFAAGQNYDLEVHNGTDWTTHSTIQFDAATVAELKKSEFDSAGAITLTIANKADQDAIINGISFKAGENGPVAGDYTVSYDSGSNELTFTDNVNTYTAVVDEAGTFELMDGTTVVGNLTVNDDALAALGRAGATDFLTFTFADDNSVVIQTGSNAGDTLAISIGDMSSEGLDVKTASIATRENASSAISTVDGAINAVSTQRASLGAMQNRLEHKINNLETSAENLQSAESRIRDIDMAKEMTKYTQTSILVQAATSMLAQANSAPQNVLSLLR